MRSVRDFGAIGDGKHDDAEAIQHAVNQGLGAVYFPPGDYRIGRPIVVDTARDGRISLQGGGGTAKIIMAGAGPAFHVTGTHLRTADPEGFKPGVWEDERLPTFLNLEIEGAHEEADGILLERTMQATFEGVLLRELRHGIHLHERNRNVIISHCHIYNNRGAGVFCDHVNLHQFNVVGTHISYCKQSGIKFLNGEVRNFQCTGCDIEYNYDKAAGQDAAPSAEIWIDMTGEGATLREAMITGCTIQARYAPGGANVRIEGRAPDDPNQCGMITITGNLIGSQETNVLIKACRAITVSNNVIYSGHARNIHATDSRNLVFTGNSIDHNPGYLPKELATCVTFARCSDSSFTGTVLQDALAGKHTVETPPVMTRKGLLELIDCTRLNVQGCQVLDSAATGIYVEKGRQVLLSGCTITDQRETPQMDAAIRWSGEGKANLVTGNILGAGRNGRVEVAEESGVSIANNVDA